MWNIDTGECSKILGTYKNGHKNQLRSLAFSPNPENLLISGADDHAIKVWDINTGKCQKLYKDIRIGFGQSHLVLMPKCL
ncbi:MAG: hypothetical protein HC903_24915 [Methylacidiphilales bacterium]|nr:hypothetical protein [Candidatus Methylacidiphilales bacterium]